MEKRLRCARAGSLGPAGPGALERVSSDAGVEHLVAEHNGDGLAALDGAGSAPLRCACSDEVDFRLEVVAIVWALAQHVAGAAGRDAPALAS